MLGDLRHGFRGLVRTPAFSIVAVVTIALGIGANTAMFSVVNGVILRPLEFPNPDRLVVISRSGCERSPRCSRWASRLAAPWGAP